MLLLQDTHTHFFPKKKARGQNNSKKIIERVDELNSLGERVEALKCCLDCAFLPFAPRTLCAVDEAAGSRSGSGGQRRELQQSPAKQNMGTL